MEAHIVNIGDRIIMRFYMIIGMTMYATGAMSQNIDFRDAGFGGAELADTALAVRSAGYNCPSSNGVERIVENGTPSSFFRVTCSNGERFQASVVDGKVFVKPWTGTLIGR